MPPRPVYDPGVKSYNLEYRVVLPQHMRVTERGRSHPSDSRIFTRIVIFNITVTVISTLTLDKLLHVEEEKLLSIYLYLQLLL